MYCQAQTLIIMAVFPSHMRSPYPRVRSLCGHARTRTVGHTATVIHHQGLNSTTLPGWRPPPATCAASAATLASSPRTSLPQTSTTQNQDLRAAAARPPSPAGEANGKANRHTKTVCQIWRMWPWEAPGGTKAPCLWTREVEEGVREQWQMAGLKMKPKLQQRGGLTGQPPLTQRTL